nr:molybdopterin-dependent oxidoreductase [Candidatus Dormibacteraeota bacterium]
DCILVMGSNMAENHPVGFQWVMEAKLKGAPVIHVDPRFTRTSANASFHVPIRAGSDIAFLGGIVHHILETDSWFKDYVLPYTNAANIVGEKFRDTEDLDGLFSGWDPAKEGYDTASWQFAGMAKANSAPEGQGNAAKAEPSGGLGGGLADAEPERDETLQHPRCVFQLLKRHFSRYTPEMVEALTGVPKERFVQVAELLCANSGRERTSAIVYSVGWTQHTVGVQLIRTAAIIQLLLGNMGRPGGGIMALRGHASIQGSTDIPTLYDLLPGYIPMPHAEDVDLQTYLDGHVKSGGGWARLDSYLISLLKAYWGEAATPENDMNYGRLPRIDKDHSTYRTAIAMLEGKVKGYFLPGENPAVGSANGKLQRAAMAQLDWLVVRDLFLIESATFWQDGPEVVAGQTRPEDCKTEVFFLPAAAHTEKSGSFTNTQRLVQWHHQAIEPPGDCRSELWFYYHLGHVIREKLAASNEERDRGILELTWDYGASGPKAEPSAEAVLREINGWDRTGRPLSGFADLKADGSTTCGCWIYSGIYADGVNQAARKKPGSQQTWVAPEWAWAWPANRRQLYNRASADPAGKPWSERKRYVWWDAERAEWQGDDVPDFNRTKEPTYQPGEGAGGDAALSGDAPFIMQGDGRGWLYAPSAVLDAPLPPHYEPHESPVRNRLYEQEANPMREIYNHPLNPYNDDPEKYPFVMTTYRLTEHHTAGAMSRNVPVLSELQPEFFCEISPELAELRGLEQGGYAAIITARGRIHARVMVTDRIAPLRVAGKTLHQVGLPYHWGQRGLTRGDSANDAFPIVLDPNVHIQEVKAATCDIRPAERPKWP